MTTSRADVLKSFGEPPPSLRLIAEVAGVEAAVQLARDHGGREIYISRNLEMDSLLVQSVGMEAAASILEALGPGAITVPLWLTGRDRKLAHDIGQRLLQGQSEAQIARALGCHIRTVRRHRARNRLPSAQMDMFALFEGEEKSCLPDDLRED